jgi:PAS domain S-box-containing protein
LDTSFSEKLDFSKKWVNLSRLKPQVFNKFLERIGQLGADEVQSYLQRLARERGFLEVVFQSIQEGVVALDKQDRIQYYNPVAARLFGWGEINALGEKVEKFLRELPWQALRKSYADSTVQLEISYPEKRFLKVRCIRLLPQEAQGQDELGYLLIVQDETEGQQAIREAAESERVHALTLLAAGVAHELGNPLNSFNIQLQLMERDLMSGGPQMKKKLMKAVKVARNEVRRLDGIVKQFLKAVRPSMPQLQLASLNAVVEASLEFFLPELSDREITVKKQLAEGLPLVEMDEDQIKQVFYNVIRNGMQAMRIGGTLEVTTRLHEGGVMVNFQDSGEGMSAETVARLFEPYYTTKREGTGLGLVIAHRIVREHGGKLNIESELGKGTLVQIWLPLPGRAMKLLPMSQTI